MKRHALALIATLAAWANPNPPAIRYIASIGNVSGSYSLAVDPAGYAYTFGSTTQTSPLCSLPILGPSRSSGPDGFVTKIDLGGKVVWTVCLTIAGAGRIGLDGSGAIYLASGSTVSKLSPNADKIIFSTSIPSTSITSMAVSQAGNVYVAGAAKTDLPTTAGAYQTTCALPDLPLHLTCANTFVAALSSNGAVQYVTFANVAGSVYGIAVDSHGNGWYVGSSIFGSGTQSFVAELSADGAHLLFYRASGGGKYEQYWASDLATCIAIDSKDGVYVAGESMLPGILFEGGYLTKFDPTGKVLYTTVIGTHDNESLPRAIAVDDKGQVYLSLDQTGGGGTAFNCSGPVIPSALTVYSGDGSTVLSAEYLPGQLGPYYAIALDSNGGIYVLGYRGPPPGPVLTVYKFELGQSAGPQLGCIVPAADLSQGAQALAPGEIITLFGRGFTPGPDLAVTFDGIAAPILYSDTRQINAVVPFGVAKSFDSAHFSSVVAIHSAAQTIGPFIVDIERALPSIFIVPGTSQILALNDDGAINSPSNPAAAGSVITMFLTGTGTLTPPLSDGQLGPTTPPFPVPSNGAVNASISWSSMTVPPWPLADVLFAGQAPGQVAGLTQLNLRIPDSVPTGNAYIYISIGQPFYWVGRYAVAVRQPTD